MAGTKQWRAADGRLQPGFQTAGFTLKQVGKLQALGAQTLYFEHEKSGASLFYIRNKDTNRGFSISYRTPHLDETDTNHVFEHSVLASSDKYPSKDIFFDLCSKTYHTFVNAFTYIPFTAYPVCSQSEEQLLKMADVYLSCMKAPGIRRERRFFDREAVRYELRDRESPITLAGTVYSEDFGMLNDTDNEALRNVLRALYPGETAANANGQAHRFYKDLTYEHTMEMYDRFYRFDNALILLYGDLDWKRFLAFLDKEYLCDAKKSYGKEDGWSFQSGSGRQEKQEMQNIGMSAFYSPEPDGLENGGESFFRQATVPSPAYRGDASENAAVVSYAMDLSGISWEKLIQYSIIAGMMNVDGSVFREKLRTAGIHCDASASVMMEAEKPFFVFEMTDSSPKDAERFRQVSDETLCEMQERGIDPSVVETALKARAIHDYTAGEDTDVFADSIVPEVSLKWALTGDADVYADEAAAYDSLDAGTAQAEIRRFAAELGAAKRRVLVTTIPTPGMAEAMEQERDAYLAQMKAEMSEAELDALIAKTLDFDAWNASECSNADFMIRVDELPPPEETPEYQIYEINGISVYESPSDLEAISYNRLYLDLSGVPEEDRFYIPLYTMFVSELENARYGRMEKENQIERYLHDFSMNEGHPEVRAGRNSHPTLAVSWYGMAEDYEESLYVLLELLSHPLWRDKNAVLQALDETIPSCDESRSDAYSLAVRLAASGYSINTRYQEYVGGQAFYEFLKKLRGRLEQEDAAIFQLAEKMEEVRDRILHGTAVTILHVAPRENLEWMRNCAGRILGNLRGEQMPDHENKTENRGENAGYTFPVPARREAVIVESSSQYTVFSAELSAVDGFSGRILPYVNALDDRYFVPQLRFQGGAYSASFAFTPTMDRIVASTYRDPKVSETIEAIRAAAGVLEKLQLSEADRNGYILSSYGNATAPCGCLGRRMAAMQYAYNGLDIVQIRRWTEEISETTAEDQKEAARIIRRLLEEAWIVTTGNQTAIEMDRDCFDRIRDFRSKMAE